MPTDPQFGARIEFLGVVRGTEAGRAIAGIRYTAHVPMVERVFGRIADGGERRFGPHLLWIHHVTGFVAAGEPSVRIEVAFSRSAGAFEACAWYLQRIKSEAPIWKEPIYESS
ncbi:hypothetical protein BH23VER1_BH23VER1_29080 [soil metagenome]